MLLIHGEVLGHRQCLPQIQKLSAILHIIVTSLIFNVPVCPYMLTREEILKLLYM
jgi:hypothetical protein